MRWDEKHWQIRWTWEKLATIPEVCTTNVTFHPFPVSTRKYLKKFAGAEQKSDSIDSKDWFYCTDVPWSHSSNFCESPGEIYLTLRGLDWLPIPGQTQCIFAPHFFPTKFLRRQIRWDSCSILIHLDYLRMPVENSFVSPMGNSKCDNGSTDSRPREQSCHNRGTEIFLCQVLASFWVEVFFIVSGCWRFSL